ncbi:hypothetical protein M407DRAFT_76947, partial [Tulasnella calospora MUT 4182]
VLDVASGLVYLHGMNPPICHGDIKPVSMVLCFLGNLLIAHDMRGMLGDFGLSRALESNSSGLTTSKTIKGSLRYMSPELFGQNPAHTLASDVWAFGCVTFEILAGVPPWYSHQSEPQIIVQLVQGNRPALLSVEPGNKLDADLQSLLNCCWSKSPGDRPDMENCLQMMQTRHELSSFELATGEGWSAVFDSEMFSEFNSQCLKRDLGYVTERCWLTSVFIC